MSNEDIPVGRIELERRNIGSTVNFASDRQAIEENRRAIEELWQMLQAIINHLAVPYTPDNPAPEE